MIVNLKDFIENSEICKNKPAFVTKVANIIIENCKQEGQRQIDLEKMKLERSKNELELAKIKSEAKSNISHSEIKLESLDQLIQKVFEL